MVPQVRTCVLVCVDILSRIARELAIKIKTPTFTTCFTCTGDPAYRKSIKGAIGSARFVDLSRVSGVNGAHVVNSKGIHVRPRRASALFLLSNAFVFAVYSCKLPAKRCILPSVHNCVCQVFCAHAHTWIFPHHINIYSARVQVHEICSCPSAPICIPWELHKSLMLVVLLFAKP
jgi:hypothetical protein